MFVRLLFMMIFVVVEVCFVVSCIGLVLILEVFLIIVI